MQSEELGYVIVTSHSIRKSRTGGILGRLISRTGLDLVGGRMFAPSADLARRYADTIVTETEPRSPTRTLVASFLFTDLVGFSIGSATEQYAAKATLSSAT